MMLGDDRIAPGEFSLDIVTGRAQEKARKAALHALPENHQFAEKAARFVGRRILEEIGLGGNASVEHHKFMTDTTYAVELTTELLMHSPQYFSTEKFMNGLEAIVQHAIKPYKQREATSVLAR